MNQPTPKALQVEDLALHYVEMFKKHSPKAYYNTLRTLYEFFEILHQNDAGISIDTIIQELETRKPKGDLGKAPRKDPQRVTPFNIDFWVQVMNARPSLGKSTKSKYLQTIKDFFDWLRYELRRNKIPFEHPVPTLKYIYFTEKDNPSKKLKKYIPYEKFEQIETLAEAHSFEMQVIILLLKHCGMRVSECVTIRREDLYTEERYLETGFEIGAQKTADGIHGLIFFFPKTAQIMIRHYLEYVNARYPDSPYLFPSRIKGKHIVTNTVGKFLRNIAEQVGLPRLSSHWFRHTLNTNRKYDTNCPKDIRKKLRNDAMGDAEDLYDDVEIRKLCEKYDEFHPY